MHSGVKARFAAIFKTRTRDDWCRATQDIDACVTPVLDLDEAVAHPHAHARNAFIDVGGAPQPAPAPRFELGMR